MARDKSNLQIKLEYCAVRGIIGAIGLLPLRSSIKTGAAFGRLFQSFGGRLNRVGKRNLEIALPDVDERERARILTGCFESLGRQLGAISHLRRFQAADVNRVIEIEGLENYIRAKETGRGVIFFTAHFGGWEASHQAMAVAGFPMSFLVRKTDNPLIENFVDRMRTRFGSRTIDKSVSARATLRLLQAGETLGILADLNTQEREGVFVDFFNVPASTTSGLAKLALRTNAAVLPGFAIWQPAKQKYLLRLEPALEYQKTGDDAGDVLQLTGQVARITENVIREYPEQWLWIHKRWNTRPPREPDLYRQNQSL